MRSGSTFRRTSSNTSQGCHPFSRADMSPRPISNVGNPVISRRSHSSRSFRNACSAEDRKSTTSELQSQSNLVCRLLLEKKKKHKKKPHRVDHSTIRSSSGQCISYI